MDDWVSQLRTELSQDEQEEKRLKQRKKRLGQSLASNEALLSISQGKHDTRVAYYHAQIAALRRTMEVEINLIGRDLSRLKSLTNGCNRELQTVKRRIELETQRNEETRNPAVFYTYREIKREAYGIFYGKNVFHVDSKLWAWGASFISTFSAYLKHIKVHVDSRTSIPDLFQDIQRCGSQLQSLRLEISEVPTYRGSQKPSTLSSLKLQAPSSAQKIKVLCSATTVTAELNEACSILHEVLAKGFYESPDWVFRCKQERSSKRRSL
ncbi:hypothetical protein VE02_09772 [Pseudogymnoascus sp. 03VT05]|nr:hypothetical protein VE02_09772 [Pseudogymnoascus sp. 03VT05]